MVAKGWIGDGEMYSAFRNGQAWCRQLRWLITLRAWGWAGLLGDFAGNIGVIISAHVHMLLHTRVRSCIQSLPPTLGCYLRLQPLAPTLELAGAGYMEGFFLFGRSLSLSDCRKFRWPG